LKLDRGSASACPDCKCDPYDRTTLGTHGGAACVSPQCPAGCQAAPEDVSGWSQERIEHMTTREYGLWMALARVKSGIEEKL
jgi:hypothetical protein